MSVIVTLAVLIIALLIAISVIRATRMSFHRLVLLAVGSIIGLLLGALISIPVANLPSPWGNILPITISLILTVVVIATVMSRADYIAEHIPLLKKLEQGPSALMPERKESKAKAHDKPAKNAYSILVDTSVIIDGRIADIAAAGFIHAKLIVPRFVLAELQNIADSEEAMRRSRGRRGLEALNQLKALDGMTVEVSSQDVAGVKEVDAKLIAVAKEIGADVLTTDYNLNRVAQIEGVRVLNINELANAIRPVVLPGEEMVIKIVQEGKEAGQGVGYLPDGTMIVVERGDKLIGQEVGIEVTRVFQTVAGKMIFAVPKADSEQQQRPTAKTKKR